MGCNLLGLVSRPILHDMPTVFTSISVLSEVGEDNRPTCPLFSLHFVHHC